MQVLDTRGASDMSKRIELLEQSLKKANKDTA